MISCWDIYLRRSAQAYHVESQTILDAFNTIFFIKKKNQLSDIVLAKFIIVKIRSITVL